MSDIHTAKFISATPNAEAIMAKAARSCFDPYDENFNAVDIINKCIEWGHWSVFEQANMALRFKTTRIVSHQLVRHKSMSFIQQSQRYYSGGIEFHFSGLEELADGSKPSFNVSHGWANRKTAVAYHSKEAYNWAISNGIPRDIAREVLLECAETHVTCNGTVRSWIHYIQARTGKGAQREHRMIAEEAKTMFCIAFPIVAEALGWVEVVYNDGSDGCTKTKRHKTIDETKEGGNG